MSRTLSLAIAALLMLFLSAGSTVAADTPNIVLIYIDDLGYGDVSFNGATAVRTPNVDRIAREGLRFTDGHSSSATCTPSRYSMLTGEYAWRRQGTGVARGDAAAIIEPGRTTLASVLRQAGYRTGVVGKWHLGLGDGDLDWNGDIKPGPLEIGFDECFILPATGDRAPCVYIENHRVANLDPNDPIQVSYTEPIPGQPTGKTHPEMLRMGLTHGHDMAIVNGISRIGHMSGGKAALWNDETMADVLTGKAIQFIEKHRQQPFFLYYSFHDIHVPRVPHPRFAGKSGLGPRGDVILQMDSCVGDVLNALDRLNLADNTLVIFTSDNGPVIDDGYADEAVEKLGKHTPSGPFRGNKYSAFEAGTRVPFAIRWPKRIKPGVSEALVCQIDFLASFAALTGQTFNKAEAVDTIDTLPALLGESPQGRQELVEHARALSLRQGSWKYIEPNRGPAFLAHTRVESGNSPEPSLFNLADDPGERTNLAAKFPDRVATMAEALKAIRNQPGAKQSRP